MMILLQKNVLSSVVCNERRVAKHILSKKSENDRLQKEEKTSIIMLRRRPCINACLSHIQTSNFKREELNGKKAIEVRQLSRKYVEDGFEGI